MIEQKAAMFGGSGVTVSERHAGLVRDKALRTVAGVEGPG